MDHIIGYSIACFSASDIKMNTFCVWHRPVVHLTGKFQVTIHINQFRWYNQFVTVWTHQNCMLLRQYNLNTSIVPSSCPTHDWEGKAPLHTPPLIVHSTLLDLAETSFRVKLKWYYDYLLWNVQCVCVCVCVHVDFLFFFTRNGE